LDNQDNIRCGTPTLSRTFIPGDSDDPQSGFAWCNTEPGVVNRVAHYHDGVGWFHVGHVLEIIPADEVRRFRLNEGRLFRTVYTVLREHYAENPESFVKEILAPAMNHAALSRRQKQ
jgi:hypothetical protein